jgi:hypothetical protein
VNAAKSFSHRDQEEEEEEEDKKTYLMVLLYKLLNTATRSKF